jgi:hypothetical protein
VLAVVPLVLMNRSKHTGRTCALLTRAGLVVGFLPTTIPAAITLVALPLSDGSVQAAPAQDYSVTVTQLTPPGASFASVVALTPLFEAGRAVFGGYGSEGVQPGFWRGTPSSWVNCKPQGFGDVNVLGAAGQQMVGAAYFNGPGPFSLQAILWQISDQGATWASLNPPGVNRAVAMATDGLTQVGWALIGNHQRPVMWTGSAQTMLELTPDAVCDNDNCGQLNCVRGGQQGGFIYGPNPYDLNSYEQAAVWSGTAASVVNLHPADAYRSVVFGTTGLIQGGYAQYPIADSNWTTLRATIWRGTAASITDLHPLDGEFSFSLVRCVDGDYQAGTFGSDVRLYDRRACLWKSGKAHFFDLHPCGYFGSEVRSIVVLPSGVIRAVGAGWTSVTTQEIPLLWEITEGPRSCCGDIGPVDGTIDGGDLGTLLANWGEASPQTVSDINHDGIVNGADLGYLLNAWGPCTN